jgi:hypothetical protein
MHPPRAAGENTSLLGRAGAVALAAVKHLPTRAALGGALGFLVGVVGVALSYVLGIAVMGREALVLGPLVAVPLAIPPLGAILFGVHGLHRGAAHAALALEAQFGLVAHVTERLLARLEERFGERLANLPLQQVQDALNDVIATYLGSDDATLGSGRGLLAYVLRRARTGIARRIATLFLAAYREELRASGEGGGIAMAKLRTRTTAALTDRFEDLLFSPLDRQRAILATSYGLLATGWWFWLTFLLSVIRRAAP